MLRVKHSRLRLLNRDYSVSQKITPRLSDILSFFFTNGGEFLIDFYTPIIHSYLR